MKLKRALLIGVDYHQTFHDLQGCVNDVTAIQPLLERHASGEKNFDCRVVTSTRQEPLVATTMLTQLQELLAPGAEVALLYFAGHAANLDNELYLVSSDGTETEPGVSTTQLFDMVFDSKIPEIVIILDCCFSGQAGQVTHRFREGALLRDGLSVLASSRANETSAETNGRGFFSLLFCQAIEGAAGDERYGWVTLVDAYEFISERCTAWTQQPVLKVNMIAPCALRQLPPPQLRPLTPQQRLKSITSRLWIPLLVVLAGIAGVWWFRKPSLYFTNKVIIDCKDGECSQDAVTRCPNELRPISRCNLQIARGACEIGSPSVNGQHTRVHVRAHAGARCFVRCLCNEGGPSDANSEPTAQ